ncbi:hypothetical protein LWI28_014822 [Acer negundo]|uniref:Uncharacterized protein n=1 Tax=Acer negundo TaxID=4023 RepID=A0AAD5JAB1_ACENE|nr:hypothetical protein LWI28_014822 [Acer negundo]
MFAIVLTTHSSPKGNARRRNPSTTNRTRRRPKNPIKRPAAARSEPGHGLRPPTFLLTDKSAGFAQRATGKVALGPTPPAMGQIGEGITLASELPTQQDGRPQETKDLAEAMI